jgi:hypothetical protein
MLIGIIVVSWIAAILLVLLFLGGGKRAELESTIYQQADTIQNEGEKVLDLEQQLAHKGDVIKRRDITIKKTRSELRKVKADAKRLTSDLEGAASRHEQAIQLFSEHRCKDHRYGKDDLFYLINDPKETPRKVIAITVTQKEGTFYSYQDGKTKRTIHQRNMRKIEPKKEGE